MIFGSKRDSKTLLHIGRELLQDIVEQEVLFYKVDLENTQENIYGEAVQRGYWSPLRLTCLIKRGDPAWSMQEYGSDLNRLSSFAFYKQDLVTLQVKPESGDIIEWHKSYFLIDNTIENQYFLGKDPWYRLDDGTQAPLNDGKDKTELGDQSDSYKFGWSVSIICNAHLTRVSNLQITRQW